MPPRSTRRQRVQEEYTEESDDNLYKRRKMDKKTEMIEKENLEEAEDYLQAVDVLNKQKENGLLLVQTELRMRLENANNLAHFEERRIQQFYEEQVAEVKRRIKEENEIRLQKRIVDESKQCRLLPMELNKKKDPCCFSTNLKEDDMVDDLLFMIRKTREIVSPRIQSIAIPLSDNRLLLDDHVIYPNTPCTVVINKVQTEGCFYVSTTIKERSDFVIQVNATKKRRFPIEMLRDGSVQLLFKEDDLRLSHTLNHSE